MMLEQSETSPFEDNLRFVKNEAEDQLQQMFKESQENTKAPFKMVKPYPGLCLKTYKLDSSKNKSEKFFINICHTKEIPAPKDISESELHKLIESANATDFKVPLSVTKPRSGKDKSNNPVEISDVAINSEFFTKKIKRGDGLFYHFVVTLIFESLELKYQIEIDTSNFILLKNRACIGELISHQIYNRDIKSVENYHASNAQNEILGADDSDNIKITQKIEPPKTPGRVLIEEITEKKFFQPMKPKTNPNEPEYRLVSDFDTFNRTIFIAEFYLPLVRDLNEIEMQANDDRLVLNSQKHGYAFDGFLPQKIDESRTKAEFDKERMILKITMSV